MLNHIVLMGRLTRDPELRRTGSGVAVASFSLAVDRDFGGRDGGAADVRNAGDCPGRRLLWRLSGESSRGTVLDRIYGGNPGVCRCGSPYLCAPKEIRTSAAGTLPAYQYAQNLKNPLILASSKKSAFLFGNYCI